MQKIGHDARGNFSILVEKFIVDVQIANGAAVAELGNEDVDFSWSDNLLLGVVATIARKNAEEQDFCFWTFLMNFIKDDPDAAGDFGGRIVVAIIGADQ